MTSCGRRIILSVVMVLVVGVGIGVVAWIRTSQNKAGTPHLGPELESMRGAAVSVTAMQPTWVGPMSVTVTEVRTGAVWLNLTPEGGGTVSDTRIEVGTSATIAGCTVGVLETHPQGGGLVPGDQESWALVAVECPASTPDAGGSASASPLTGQ